jgi:hypothetical protein
VNYSWPIVIEKNLMPIYVDVVRKKRDKPSSCGIVYERKD